MEHPATVLIEILPKFLLGRFCLQGGFVLHHITRSTHRTSGSSGSAASSTSAVMTRLSVSSTACRISFQVAPRRLFAYGQGSREHYPDGDHRKSPKPEQCGQEDNSKQCDLHLLYGGKCSQPLSGMSDWLGAYAPRLHCVIFCYIFGFSKFEGFFPLYLLEIKNATIC